MSLPIPDIEYLTERRLNYTATGEGGMTCVVLPGFQVPDGYDRRNADLLLRLSPGYPDVPPDMWWFDPPVRLPDGTSAPATESVEHYLGRSWQRWSRHFAPGQWHSGADCLESFLALIRKELTRCAHVSAR